MCLGLFALTQGCAHYSKGSGSDLPFDRIYVAPVKNDSFAPQAQALLTKQIRSKLVNQTNLEIAPSPSNAAILEITITKFGQSIATTSRNDTVQAHSFDVKMTVVCTLRDSETEKVYFSDYSVSDSVECHGEGDYQGAKHQIMPQLTEKLAEKICEIVCNPW
jgi:hypothetical protein